MSAEVAERLTDKYTQRARAARGRPARAGLLARSRATRCGRWEALAREASFPAVLKPRRGEGSRDTVRVDSLQELRGDGRADARRGRSAPPELVLEEYLRDRPEAAGQRFADYVSVESVVSGGRISHLAITGRFPPAEPFRETGFFIPCAFDQAQCAAIADVATAAVQAIGIDIGALHTEVKLTPEGPRVIEVNGRIGGGVPEMLADATGVRAAADRHARGSRRVDRVRAHAGVRADRLPVVCSGAPGMKTIRDVDGLEQLRARGRAGSRTQSRPRPKRRLARWQPRPRILRARSGRGPRGAELARANATVEVKIHGD